jgi:polysaccharide pyruvyl transferase WcaK-like protein
VALLHYGDVANFGDVLFPLLAARELHARIPSLSIDFISPTGTGPAAGIRYDTAVFDHYDAIVLAGGELIHRDDAMLRAIYERLGLRSIEHPTDVVFGWTNVEGPYKAWFGVGVPRLDADGRDAVRQHCGGLHTVLLRGTGSARRMAAAGGSGMVSADLGWLFPRLRAGQPVKPSRRAVLHVLPHGVPDLHVIVEPLRILEKRGLEIVLLPLSTCWGDEEILGRIAEHAGFTLIDHRTPVLTKLQILGDSSLYIGQSMHGFIASLASGHPAGLCAPAADDKFSELLIDHHLEDLRVGTWDQLPRLIDRLLAVPDARIQELRTRLAAQVSAAFDTLAVNIVAHVAGRPSPAESAPA